MMKKGKMLILILLSIGTLWASEINMKPGKWEIVTETTMQGAPGGMQMPPQKFIHTQCLTREEMIPKSKETGGNCRISDLKQDGDTIRWKITCNNAGGKSHGSGQISYHGTRFEGTMTIRVEGEISFSLTSKMEGRWIGECTP
jgi:hypothetical protein